jgi:hypothetical protein
MVEQADAEQVGTLPESASEHTILWAGCRISGRVIVRTNPGAAFIRISGLNTSRGCTMANVREPIETMLTPMMRASHPGRRRGIVHGPVPQRAV